MKKFISFITAVISCVSLSVTALAETIIIAPSEVSDPDIKTSVLVEGNGIPWIIWVLLGFMVLATVMVIINKKKNK